MRRVNWNSWLSDICIILFAAAFSLFLNQLFVIGEIASLSEAYAKVGQDQFTQSFELGLLLYCVCSPILEELLFRLIVQKGLNFLFHTGVRGRRIVLVVSALAFACYHGNVVQGLFAFPMGIFMALFYELLGNVAAPILFHVSANLTTWIVSNGNGFAVGQTGLILCVIYAILAGVLGTITLKRIVNNKKNSTII